MGDVRFREPYRKLRDAVDPLAALRQLSDEEVIQALAAAPRREDPYLVNVLATEAMNRSRRSNTINRTLGEGVVALDRAGRVTYLNPAAEDTLGYDFGDLRHRLFHHAVHAGDPQGRPVPAEQCAIHRALHHRERQSTTETFLRADGHRFPVEVTVSPILREGDAEGAILVFRDVTARMRAERALRNRLALEQTIARIGSQLLRADDLDPALDDALEHLGRAGGASRAYLFQTRRDGRLMDNTHEWCAPNVPPERENLQGLPIDTYAWSVERLRRGEPLIVEDVRTLPPEAEMERRTFEAQGIRSLAIVPVSVAGEYAGFLGFDDVTGAGTWTREDLSLLEVASGLLGAALGRHRSMEALRLRDFGLDHAGEAIFLVKRDGRILYANHTACEQLGYTRDELLEMTLPQITADATDLDWDAHWSRVRETGPITLEALHRCADGTLLPVESRISHLEFKGHTYEAVFARDVAARKRAEHRLRESEQRYRSLFELHPDAVFSLDLQGRFTAANAACERVSGYAPTELMGRPFDPLVVPEDRERARRHFELAAAGHPQRANLRIAHRDGHHVDVTVLAIPTVVSGRVTGIYGVATRRTR